MITVGQQLTLVIEDVNSRLQGLARSAGQVVFVEGALPGETVEAEVCLVRPDYLEARATRIISAHPSRVEPVCPYFQLCGGCQLLHLDYAAQPALKAEAIRRQLARGKTFDTPLPVTASPQSLGYRSRVRFKLDKAEGGLALGFYAPLSNRHLAVTACWQLDSRLNAIIGPLNQWLAEFAWPIWPEQMEALAVQDGYLITLDWPAKPGPEMIARWAEADWPFLAQIAHRVRGRLFAPRPEGLRAASWFNWHGTRLQALPGAFTQINLGINSLIIDQVAGLASSIKPKRVLDLYAGLGNFSLPLSLYANQVVGVEENPQAVKNAQLNAKYNQIKNARFAAQKAEAFLKAAANQNERFDLAILDPPRAGAKGLAVALARLGARHILYLSCHPQALNRDLVEFASLGYKTVSLTGFDMFPQTHHLEVLAHLSL